MRNRSLGQINHKLLERSRILEDEIDALLRERASVNVLELGFGEGRVLMELASAYRERPVRFHGVDGHHGERPELREVASRYEIAQGSEVTLPDVRYYRLGLPLEDIPTQNPRDLEFDDETIDLVYSAVMIRFVRDKAQLLEDVARVLRPGGLALLHIGGSGCRYEPLAVGPEERITPGPAYLVVRDDERLIPVEEHMGSRSSASVTVEAINEPHLVVRLRKLARGRLDLGLELDAATPMGDLRYEVRPGIFDDGVQSVYRPRITTPGATTRMA